MSISAVIPAYNATSSLGLAIQSLRSCGIDDIIVVDDGSTDATSSLALSLGARLISQKNSGAYAARETGIHAAQTELVVLLDADDVVIPAGMKSAIRHIYSRPHLGCVAGQVLLVGHDERPLPVWKKPATVETLLALGYSPWPPAAAVWRRAALLDAVNMEPPALRERYADDYELLVRVAMRTGVEQLPILTARYSISGGKSTKSGDSDLACAMRVREYYARHCGVYVRRRSKAWVKSASDFRRASAATGHGRRREAFLFRLRATTRHPRYATERLINAAMRIVRGKKL